MHLTDPVQDSWFFAYDKGDGSTIAAIQGYLFSNDGPGYAAMSSANSGMEGLA